MSGTIAKPISVGELLVEQFLVPLGWTPTDLAGRSGLPRKHIKQLCSDKRALTPETALILAKVFGNSAEFWQDAQQRVDQWEALHAAPPPKPVARAFPLDAKPRRRIVA